MGQVLAVRDPSLHRDLAMKVLNAQDDGGEALARFLDEAQLTAQLQHPGVVPVHALGRLPTGQPYFTMQVVRGRTLRALVETYHEAPTAEAPAHLYRLMTIFNQVCETIAYAHRQGILHRDLKPENVMVGEFGEVRVLDWGLAKRLEPGQPESGTITLRTHRDSAGAHETLAGEVMGTPVYMSPEQARGQNPALTRASDVYSLAAMLFQILTGRPPFEGAHAMAVMMRVVGGLRNPLEGCHPIPRALREICDRGMNARPEARFPDAGVLQHAVAAWLSGTQQRERALQLVAEASAIEGELSVLEAAVERSRHQAEALRRLAQDAAAGDEAPHLALWTAEDELQTASLAVEAAQVRREQLLHSALSQSPDLPEARVGLARHYRAAHAAAESRHDAAALLRTEALLREQAEALPPVHPERSGFLEYLAGEGTIQLSTVPENARVLWQRFVPRGRRLVLETERELRPTPLRRAWLPRGSHVLRLSAPGYAEIPYPVFLERLGRWDAEETLHLPAADTLGPDDCFVAAGPALFGGDPEAHESGPRRRERLRAFVVRRDPVTNAEYLAFLNDLALQGRAEEAVRLAPRVTGASQFTWKPDLPVVLVDRACAEAYARWRAERDALPWRLPTALEWEKAARGVDGRAFPWGDVHHAGWTNLRERHAAAPVLLGVAASPVDESPYGVRGLSGNVREWTSDEVEGPAGRQGIVKGGGYLESSAAGRCAGRTRLGLDHRDTMTGFRLVRDADQA
jgi:serine/threonine-protein kinase